MEVAASLQHGLVLLVQLIGQGEWHSSCGNAEGILGSLACGWDFLSSSASTSSAVFFFGPLSTRKTLR